MEVINMVKRSLAGTLREKHIDETVLLKGWVDKRRDLGGLIFVDLRDKSGAIQVVFNPDYSQAALEIAETIRSELDRKSTRLNSSHVAISYAVFCLKKKKYSTRIVNFIESQLSVDSY